MINFYSMFYNLFWGYIFGIVISIYFFKRYIYKGPDSNIIRKKIYKRGEKCFKLVPYTFICPYNEKHI